MTKRIGKYEIQAEIGSGGFGKVYVALDPVVNRQVAIKVLISADDPETLRRFRAEAAAAGRLRHKNVVTVYDYGEWEGVPYLVMEYLEGQTLQQILRGPSKLSLLEKMQIMSQTAEGLHCAHQNGIVHRDVKPANIMVLRDGTVKIMDFGIARALQSDTATRTRTGFLIGTLAYMSPEQFQEGPVDALCDIWAYGVIYYELVAGVHPFEAADAAGLMYRINSAEPRPVRTAMPDCPEALAAILKKALAKDREIRYQSLEDVQYDAGPILVELKRERAAEMVSELRALLEQGEVNAASRMIRSVFELDPANRDARQLREAIQEQLQWRAVKPKVQALVKSGEESLAQRQFPEAIQMFESALRLDNGDSSLRIRIEQARDAYEQCQRAAQLVSDAQQQLTRKDLTAAHRSAAEALRNDPQNPQAGQLLEAINRDIERREQERQLKQSLATAEELLSGGDHDAAVRLLIDLNLRHPRTAAITSLLAQAQSLKTDAERRRSMRRELDAARELVTQQRFSEAVRRLERLGSEFAQDESFIALLTSAREGLIAHEGAEKLRRVMEQAKSLLAEGNFDRAADVLVEALRAFPGDDAVAALLREALHAKAENDRRQEIARTLRRAEHLRSESRVADALETVETSLRKNTDVPELLTLRARLLQDLETQKRDQAVLDAKARAGALLTAGRPTDALDLLSQTAADFLASGELAPLLAKAEEARREHARAESIQAGMDEAAALEAGGRKREALARLDALSREHPTVARVADAAQRLRAEIAAAAERERAETAAAERQRAEIAAPQRPALSATQLFSPQVSPEAPPIQPPLTAGAPAALPVPGVSAPLETTQPRKRPLRLVLVGAVGISAVIAAGTWLAIHGSKPVTETPADLIVPATPLSFRYTIGGDKPAPAAIPVSSKEGARFVSRADAKWIAIQPASGWITQAGSPVMVRVSVDPAGLPAAGYSGEVLIEGADRGSVAHHLPVTLEVTDAPVTVVDKPPVEEPKPETHKTPEIIKPEIRVSSGALEFSVTGDASGPLSRKIDVSVTPGLPFSASVSEGRPWLEILQSRGGSRGQIEVRINPKGLPPGTHSGAVAIVAGGVTKPVSVTLKVEAPPPIVVKPDSGAGAPVIRPKAIPFSVETYGGKHSGVLRWQGELQPGALLTIEGGRVSSGRILSGKWEEGIPIGIGQLPGTAKLQQIPTEANKWIVIIVNDGPGPLTSLSIPWQVKAQ